uniref:ZP domain-containing protein n=1 Tax=Parascaris equorum TaxID=6256 RepID=A0A914RFH1_PAREQ
MWLFIYYSYGQVGEQIYHVWECDDDTHGFLVHSCFVNDGRGTQFDLMDVDGCPVDPIIQPEVVYDDNLKRAVAETWGYKFSDTSVLNYQCVVELCRKDVGECDGLSPPSCGRSKREIKTVASRRSRRRTGFQPQTQMDLIATVNMLDSLDEDGISDPRTEKFIRKVSEVVCCFTRRKLLAYFKAFDKICRQKYSLKIFDLLQHRFHPRSGIAISPANRTCLSRLTIGVFAITIAFTFIISAATTAILFKRTKFAD